MQTNKNFVLRKIYDQNLLIPIHDNEVGDELISLNEIGADIWNLASMGESYDDIILHIDEVYNLQPDSVEEKSIKNFINTLCDMNILHR